MDKPEGGGFNVWGKVISLLFFNLVKLYLYFYRN